MRISIELGLNSLKFKTENLSTEMYREEKKTSFERAAFKVWNF